MRRSLLLAPLLLTTAVVVWTGIRVREAPERKVVRILATGPVGIPQVRVPVDLLARIEERLGTDLGGRYTFVEFRRGGFRQEE